MKGLSLFSGMGGDTLGMKNAGIDVVAFNELNKTFIKTHEKNFENCKFIGKDTTDIMKIKDQEIEEHADIDIIFAGFPCQGFSNAGKKMPSDPRNTLFREFIRFTRIIKPKYIIGENVKGLVSRKTASGENYIDVIVKAFQDIGYNINYRVFKANEYGVPQKRERLIIIGARNDLNTSLTFPEPLNTKPNLKDIVTFNMKGAIKFDYSDLNIPDECILKDLENEEEENDPHPYLSLKANPTLEQRTHVDKAKDKTKIHQSLISFSKRDSPIHSEIIDIRNPSKTIICSYDHQPRFYVPLQNKNGMFIRCLLPDELKQIQGFPADFEILGNDKQKIVQIGNAVPPPLITKIVEALVI